VHVTLTGWGRALRLTHGVLLLSVVALSSCSHAQTRSTSPSSTPLVEGEAAPEASSPGWHDAPGTADRRCVDVDRLLTSGEGGSGGSKQGRILDVRSGELVAGNFANLDGAGRPGDSDFAAKIYWEPLHNGVAKANVLTVTTANLSAASRSTHTRRFGGPGRWARTNEGYYFWATGVRLPGHGRWRLNGVARGVWGCFIVST
jgi:hypothetical protein